MTTIPATGFQPLRDTFQARLFGGMSQHIERLHWKAHQIADHQRRELRSLLAHASENSPFHRRRLGAIDPATFEVADLAGLPVMTKADLMNEFDEVLTDPRLNQALVEEALARTTAEPIPVLGRYLAIASGGSSGRRGVYVTSVEELVETISSALRPLAARAGAHGLPPGGMTIAFVAAPTAVHATGCGPAMLADSPLNMVSVPSTLPLIEIVERLNVLQPWVLFGYAGVLRMLAREQLGGRLRVSPVGVTSTSETMTAETRAAVSAGFGVPVVDTFGSSEGLYGATAPDDSTFVFSSDLCIVELVDEQNRPVPDGSPSAKILVTNLANRTQPLIRYEMTDRFVRRPAVPEHGHLRATVEGRTDEVFHYSGVEIHPIVVRSRLVTTPSVLDYQVRQTERGIHVTILSESSAEIVGLQADLAAGLAAAGLADPDVTVETTSGLSRHHETGKLRRFVPIGA
jgi:phenylacetate-coenzyme A ligase PaaK-like adenylate-forming protein